MIVLIFFKSNLDNKMSSFEEYEAFNNLKCLGSHVFNQNDGALDTRWNFINICSVCPILIKFASKCIVDP